MNEKILIFGGGQIGNLYLKYFIKEKISVKLDKADITDIKQISRAINSFKPSVVINTAAFTNLEECNDNKLEAFKVNVLGADNLAQACDKKGIYFIHFSSGCIFQSKDKNDAKKEDDLPEPVAYYSFTKVWSEQLVKFNKSSNFKYLILRPRQPVSSEVNYKNMLMKLLTFTKFVDTPNSGTVLEDLMDWTNQIIKKKPIGVFHVVNPGFSTPYRIGLMLKKHILPSLQVKKISKKELDKIVPNKRVDTILNIDKFKSLGIKPMPFEKRLEETIIKLGENIRKADKDELKEQLKNTIEQSKQRTSVNECWKDLLK
ncbi:MAG: sugar nucleotide-binding protein [bacterium]